MLSLSSLSRYTHRRTPHACAARSSRLTDDSFPFAFLLPLVLGDGYGGVFSSSSAGGVSGSSSTPARSISRCCEATSLSAIRRFCASSSASARAFSSFDSASNNAASAASARRLRRRACGARVGHHALRLRLCGHPRLRDGCGLRLPPQLGVLERACKGLAASFQLPGFYLRRALRVCQLLLRFRASRSRCLFIAAGR